jgi:hypothetical protein
MSLPKEITLTRTGGRFFQAMTFHYASLALFIVPVGLALIVAVLNPFWFRDKMFSAVERRVNRFARWRDYLKYRIYLGTDPKMWHTLKGDV